MKSICISEWLRAEEELRKRSIDPQPVGSITVGQFAKTANKSLPTARRILAELRQAGLATSKQWKNGKNGVCNVFFLKDKKNWPKK